MSGLTCTVVQFLALGRL